MSVIQSISTLTIIIVAVSRGGIFMKKIFILLTFVIASVSVLTSCDIVSELSSELFPSNEIKEKAIEIANKYVDEYLDADVRFIKFRNGFEPSLYYVRYETGDPSFEFEVRMSKDFSDIYDDYFNEYCESKVHEFCWNTAKEFFQGEITGIYVDIGLPLREFNLKEKPEMDRFMNFDQIIEKCTFSSISIAFDHNFEKDRIATVSEKVYQFLEKIKEAGIKDITAILRYADQSIYLYHIDKLTSSDDIVNKINEEITEKE